MSTAHFYGLSSAQCTQERLISVPYACPHGVVGLVYCHCSDGNVGHGEVFFFSCTKCVEELQRQDPFTYFVAGTFRSISAGEARQYAREKARAVAWAEDK